MQRLLDILMSGLAILIISPVLIIIGLVLRFTGEGEILFVQQRMGKGGQKFGLYKFATMLKNSPQMGTQTVTVKDDPRVLPVGKFLRKTKLNELPQLFNILGGDMSIIGPRPQTQRCFDAFPPASQAAIIQVRPGLSGVGSIVFRGEEEMMDASEDPDRVYDQIIKPYKGKLEEWYVTHRNLATYVISIFVTGWVVIFPKSRLAWRAFPNLPEPPEELISYFEM